MKTDAIVQTPMNVYAPPGTRLAPSHGLIEQSCDKKQVLLTMWVGAVTRVPQGGTRLAKGTWGTCSLAQDDVSQKVCVHYAQQNKWGRPWPGQIKEEIQWGIGQRGKHNQKWFIVVTFSYRTKKTKEWYRRPLNVQVFVCSKQHYFFS